MGSPVAEARTSALQELMPWDYLQLNRRLTIGGLDSGSEEKVIIEYLKMLIEKVLYFSMTQF